MLAESGEVELPI